MATTTNDRIAAIATVATDGDLEVLNADPFAARIVTPDAPVLLATYRLEPADTTVIELGIAVARVSPSPALDSWIARIAPELFNVHVAARDSDGGTIVEARSSLTAEGLTVESLNASLVLLTLGAAWLANQLNRAAQKPVQSPTAVLPSSDAVAFEEPRSVTGRAAPTPVGFAGYL